MMTNVDTNSETLTSVTQVVYKAVFEGTEMFREISKEQAEKRRAEDAAREEAVREKNQEKKRAIEENSQASANTSPSVILDVKSVQVDQMALPDTTSDAAPKHTVNVVA